VAVLNGASGQVGAAPAYLLFDQSIDARDYASKIKVVSGSDSIDVRVFRPNTVEIAPNNEYDQTHILAFRFQTLPPDGTNVNVTIPSFDEAGNAVDASVSLTVFTDFSVEWNTNIRKNVCPLEARFNFNFTNRFDAEVLRKSIGVEPAPRSLDFDSISEGSCSLRLSLDPGRKYRIWLKPAFHDIVGNRLAKKFDITVMSQDLDPLMKVPALPLVVETGFNRIPLKLRNVKDVKADVYLFPDAASYVRALAASPDRIDRRDLKLHAAFDLKSQPLEMNAMHSFDLGIDKNPGLKLVLVTGAGQGSQAGGNFSASVLLQSTGMGVTAKLWEGSVLVWVVDLATAAPVAGAKIALFDDSGNKINESISGKDGTAIIPVGISGILGPTAPLSIAVTRGRDTSILRVNDKNLSMASQFGLTGASTEGGKLEAALFTDRGAYRPGETVHAKIFSRSTGPNLSCHVTVRDPLGQELLSKSLSYDKYGGASFDLKIEEGGAVGEYIIEASRDKYAVRAAFRVEEYRVPTFAVKVESAEPEWAVGATSTVNVSAAYLHGGKMDGRQVKWRVYRQFDNFAPAGLDEYSFFLNRDPGLTGVYTEGVETLSGESSARVAVAPDHPAAAGVMTYIFEAAVQDHDNQVVANRMSRKVHGAAYYAGVRAPSRTVLAEGEKLTFPVVVVDTKGKPVANKSVELFLDTLEFHSATMINATEGTQTYNREVISSKPMGSLKSAKGPVEYTLVIPSSGRFRLRASVKDPTGRESSAGFIFTATGNEPVAWPRFDKERIDLVTDKASYAPGETAVIVAQTPYKEAVCLVTVEGEKVLDRQVVTINGTTPGIPVRIKANYAPNVFVSVTVIRSRKHALKDAAGFETGAPGFKLGYAELKVNSKTRNLTLDIVKGSELYSPGQTAKVTVRVKASDGKPVQTSLAVMVVDEAVLSLTNHKTPDPLSLALVTRSLGVRNGSNILDLPHSRRSRLEALFPGGDSDVAGFMAADQETLRRLFKSTAYWNPALETDKNGFAMFSFALPDNLTTFRIMVVGADATGRMGSADSKIVVSKPLMVQPVLPRFAYPGDSFNMGVRIFNATPAEGKVSLEPTFTGIELTGPTPQAVVTVAAGSSIIVPLAVRIPKTSASGGNAAAVMTFKAKMGSQSDFVEAQIPILSPGNKETLVASGQGSTGVSLALPAKRVPGTLKVEAVVSTTPLSELKDSVQYLLGYPNGCIEQTTSTAYPLIVLKDLLPTIGVEVNLADLKKFAEAGVERVLSFQTPSGGLSYWPGGSEPHAFATAFGLTVLIEAKKRGYKIPDAALGKMADFLDLSLKSGTIQGEMPHGSIPDGDTRALFVMTLGRLDRPQKAYIQTLWSKKEVLTAFGLSFLAIAVKESNGDPKLIEAILAEIKKASTQETNEAYYKGQRDKGWSFGSPLRTHAGALVAYAAGGAADPMSQKLLKGLLARRTGGLWGNTQENVFGIMGIYQIATGGTGSISGQSASGAGLVLNGKIFSDQELEKNSKQVSRITLVEKAVPAFSNTLTCSSQTPGTLITLRASFEKPLEGSFLAPTSHGMKLRRSYETLDGKSLDSKEIPLGSVIKVRLFLENGSSLHYTAIDDKLPAGLEALNANLATTEGNLMGTPSDAALRTLPVVSYQEIRDHRVAFYADELLAGSYEFVYLARATTAGTYLRPAGRAEAMYDPTIAGTTETDYVTVK
jgi:hypothetical protein